MLLANIYLLCWEFDKWQALIPGFGKSNSKIRNNHLDFFPTLIASGVSGLLAFGLLLLILGIVENSNVLYPAILATVSLLASGYLLIKYRSNYIHS